MLDNLFFSKTELNTSFREFHSRKRADAFKPDKRGEPSLITLIQNHEAILSAALEAIRCGDYRLGEAEPHIITTDKERLIQHFNWLDTFLMFHLARTLNIIAETLLSDSVYSFRIGKSAAGALSKLKSFIKNSSQALYVVKRDISNFGESMLHDVLKGDFVRYAKPQTALQNLFAQICSFNYKSQNSSLQNKAGLPGGHYIQLVAENLYLVELDQALDKFQNSIYLRFGDDILFASPEKSLALKAQETLESCLKSRGLVASQKKSLNLLLTDLSRPREQTVQKATPFSPQSNFEYLGSQVFFNGELAIPAHKLQVFRSDLKRRIRSAILSAPQTLTTAERIGLAISSAQNAVREGFLFDGQEGPLRNLLLETHNERQLKELDRWLELQVLKAVFAKGNKKGNFRAYPPSKLRTLGLPSLLHLRRVGGVH